MPPAQVVCRNALIEAKLMEKLASRATPLLRGPDVGQPRTGDLARIEPGRIGPAFSSQSARQRSVGTWLPGAWLRLARCSAGSDLAGEGPIWNVPQTL